MPELPAALADLPLNEWRDVSLNTMQSQDPCEDPPCAWWGGEGPKGILNDWTGGAYASGEGELGGLVYFGGGHNGYYGNEVYFFDFASLMWERRGEPTDGQVPGDKTTLGGDEFCRFWDGKPVSMHTYDMPFYDPIQNRFWLAIVSDFAAPLPGFPEGCSSKLSAFFDLSTNTWGDSTTDSTVGKVFTASAWDDASSLAWFTDYRSKQTHSFDPVTEEWKSYPGWTVNTLDALAAVDPVRNLLVTAAFRGDSKDLAIIDLSTPDVPAYLATTTGDKEMEVGGNHGFEWAPQLGGFITWRAGLDLFLLTPPDGDPKIEPWVWTRIVATGEVPDMPMSGPYSKFQYVPELGIAFVASHYAGPVSAIRLAYP